MTIQQLAAEAYACFEWGTRVNGDKFLRLEDGSPKWVEALVHTAHGDFFPDDRRYEMIRDILGSIEECDDIGAVCNDLQPDVFTMDRFRWLASHIDRQHYVDDAVKEYGYPSEYGLYEVVGWGQVKEQEEVFDYVQCALEERIEELEGDES